MTIEPQSNSQDPVLLYMTVGTSEEAMSISEALVSERLIACANVLGPMTSVYQWQGKIEKSPELLVLMKSRADLVDRVSSRVAELHTYDCPCLTVVPLEGGLAPFLDWISEETRPS